MTIISGIYAFLKKPIYEIKADIQVGFITNINNNNKIYLMEPNVIKLYINNNFDNSNNKIKYPNVKVNFVNNTKDILNLTINAYSNKEAINYLNKILNSIKNLENKKLNTYIRNINAQINILKNHIQNEKNKIMNLNIQLKNTKDPLIYKTILENINKYQKNILDSKLEILNIKEKLSNITKSQIIGKIQKQNYPIKPKKKLIIIIGFFTSFTISIIILIFIEFINDIKKEKKD
jgi:uncharacterized protein involved in exopolysaccharide biosynthesis